MAINLAQIKNLLLPGLYHLTGKYDEIPAQWDKMFKTVKSTLAVESALSTRYFGLAQYKQEGGPTAFDNNAGQRYVYNAESQEVGLGFSITRKAIDDNQYKKEFAPNVEGLQMSFHQFKEYFGANIFNNATTYDASIGGDGQALCSTAHPVDGGSYANRPTTDQDLNETSLLSAMISIRTNFVNEANLKIYARGKKLLIPPALEPIAIRLLKSELRPGTSDNDVNAIMSTTGGLSEGYMVNDYFTSSFAWFLKTNIEGLVHLKRVAYETDLQTDFTTDNLLCKGYERYTFSYNDPRAVYGSFPTS